MAEVMEGLVHAAALPPGTTVQASHTQAGVPEIGRFLQAWPAAQASPAATTQVPQAGSTAALQVFTSVLPAWQVLAPATHGVQPAAATLQVSPVPQDWPGGQPLVAPVTLQLAPSR